VPIAAAIALLGLIAAVPMLPTLAAAGLFGAMLGFAPFNRPVASMFLGDVGSLPIGLICGWLLLELAGRGHVAAALLLPLYYLADATLTLARRILAGEKFWRAHRDHFYQRATRRGLATWQVIARVATCNILLCSIALLIAGRPPTAQFAALALGVAAVAFLMRDLVRERT
jgi:UDP-N-acetylmuramyl pentapeptide phosphotransferase/UDP-N-acetylglucosamine-1-phosphate transferase